MPQGFKRTAWSETRPPSTDQLTLRLLQEGLTPVLMNVPSGWRTPVLRHRYAMLWRVISGWLRLRVYGAGDAKMVMLRDGDRLELASDLSYELEAAGEAYAIYLQVTPFALPPLGPPAGRNGQSGREPHQSDNA